METAGKTRWLALGAVAGPVLFTLTWVVLGYFSAGFVLLDTQIAPRSGILLPISALTFGPTGPFMNTGFVLCGLLLLVGVVGIFQSIREMDSNARLSCIVLLALSPLGLVAEGICSPKTLSYALGFTPFTGGFALDIHSLGFFLAFGSPVLSFLIAGLLLCSVPRCRRFGSWLLLGSPLTLLLLVLFLATFNPLDLGGVAQPMTILRLGGVMQRGLILEVHAWFVTLGWVAFARSAV